MLSIRFHGRGGQGTVIASTLLANALFREGWEVQAFPSFGAERTGAPVTTFVRADRRPITLRCQVHAPDIVVVLDTLLMRAVDVTVGVPAGGRLLVNSTRLPFDLNAPTGLDVATCDATGIALVHGLGTRTQPMVNTVMIGALATFTGLVAIDTVIGAISDIVPLNVEANQAAAREASTRLVASTPPPVHSHA